MLHLFSAGGRNLALDSESGALYQPDSLAMALWPLMAGNKEAAIAALPAHDPLAVSEAYDDWKTLLDAPPAQDDRPEDSGLLKAICLHVAHDCNLRCRYCFASTGGFKGSRSLMRFETGQAALDMLLAASGDRPLVEVDFFGGEPMLNWDVVKALVAYGRKKEKQAGKRFQFTLTTNAYELPADAAGFLNDEMHNLVLSIDGRQWVHDAMRPAADGTGSYDKALRNAQNIIAGRDDREYFVRGTFTRANLDFAEDVKALAAAGFDRVSVEPVVLDAASPLSLLEQHVPAIEAEYDRLLEWVFAYRQQNPNFHFFHFLADLEGGPCLKKRLSGCGAGVDYLAVTPQGQLYPCHQFVGRESYSLGDVGSGLQRPDIREAFTQNHVLNKAECAACWARYHCCGGCAANAQAATGHIGKPYDMECRLQKKRLECALALYALENGDEAAI